MDEERLLKENWYFENYSASKLIADSLCFHPSIILQHQLLMTHTADVVLCQAQMNDASEVLAVIFECLHKAFVPNSSSDGDSESSATGGSWDCQGLRPCMAHALFGLDVAEQMNCQYCGLESRHFKYTTFFHNINASSLRTAKVCSKLRETNSILLHHQYCEILESYDHRNLSAQPLSYSMLHIFAVIIKHYSL
jgi:hypothetical protein